MIDKQNYEFENEYFFTLHGSCNIEAKKLLIRIDHKFPNKTENFQQDDYKAIEDFVCKRSSLTYEEKEMIDRHGLEPL